MAIDSWYHGTETVGRSVGRGRSDGRTDGEKRRVSQTWSLACVLKTPSIRGTPNRSLFAPSSIIGVSPIEEQKLGKLVDAPILEGCVECGRKRINLALAALENLFNLREDAP